MRTLMLSLVAGLAVVSVAHAQPPAFDRLSPDELDVVPPSARVSGAPGSMTIRQTSCRSLGDTPVRRRIVDVAVQEWAFFGFSIVDQTSIDETAPRPRPRRGFRWLGPEESARVAASIAGYWTVTPEGSWILQDQNEAWKGPNGVTTRWRAPWSAAFVSWVMCEGGLGDSSQFRRAVAHHSYIDQAIRARDDNASQSAFAAYDIGEAAVEPGDLLCSARRPAYHTLAERRRQMGDGARTHCDIVVKLDEAAQRILAIGGNVRGTVSLKLLPAIREESGRLRPTPAGSASGRGGARPTFAHLKLRAAPIEANALDNSPTIKAIGCTLDFGPPARLLAANITRSERGTATC